MSDDFGWAIVLAGFGLGLATGLLVPMLARGWSRQWLLAASGPARLYCFLAVGLLAVLSAVVLVGGRHEPAIAGAAAMPLAMGTTTGARDSALARQHKVPTERSLQDAVAVSARMLGRATPGMATPRASTPGDVAALLAQAEERRRKREFKQACDVFAVIVKRGGMTADAWADYADAQAGVSGQLSGEPARAIEAALAADPQHPKALWLKASLAHEEQRYDDALGTWQRLLAVVPAGSTDARIVTANIAEATRLASN
jgi:cytochrome c-type biogenesis protein CcmH